MDSILPIYFIIYLNHFFLQKPFDDVHSSYCDDLTPSELKDIKERFGERYKTNEFLHYLFDYITLKLNKDATDIEDEDCSMS